MLFEPYVVFIVLVFGQLSGHLLRNSCSLGLQYVILPTCQFSFFPPRFWEWGFLSDCAFS